MPDVLLKRWSDWSSGVGYPLDEGANGMHTANKLLGLRGGLRPAPKATTVAVGAATGHHFQYFFEEPLTTDLTPTYDAKSVKTDSSSTSTTMAAHTVADQANRILVVFIVSDDIPTGVAFDGASFSFAVGSFLNTVSNRLTAWYLVAPTVTSTGIIITWASSQTSVVAIASSWYNVDQTGPFGKGTAASDNADAGPCEVTVTSKATTEVVIAGGAVTDSVQTMTEVIAGGGAEVDNQTTGDLRLCSSWDDGAASVLMKWTLGAACDWAVVGLPLVGVKDINYLYAQRGKKSGSSSTVRVNKVSLANNDFANLETGDHNLTPLTIPGQPVRHSGSGTTGGFWHFPMGDNRKARKLSVVGVGAVSNDTLDATGAALGADHFANLGSQVAASLAHSSNDDGGMRILKVGGDIVTEADWGAVFPTGDRSERAAGLRSLAGLSFVLNVEGLYSFNKSARSRLVFEDFRTWRHAFDNIAIVPWKGGLVLSHPTGLLFYEPGKLPVNIGLNADIGGSVIAPSGPPELRGGRYHGLAAVGDFLWTIYQPDVGSTTANVMVGYPREGSPYDLVWQQPGETTLQDTDNLLGCFVSVSSRPVSAEYVTPTLWYGDGDDLDYKVLSTTGSPFRVRADTHVVEAAGDAYMSELMFEKPTKMREMVVYTQNMVAGDEWQLKFIADGEEEKNFGPPIKRNGRHVFKVDRHDVYRLMLHVNWATTVTTARVAPSIQRIELYGPTPRP